MSQQAEIEWRDGTVPVSTRFDDPYYSMENGLAETRHVFLDGNDLPARFDGDFHVAELGFGTGLNLLSTLMIWPERGQLQFTTFEAFPMSRREAEAALAHFPELSKWSARLLEVWDDLGQGPVALSDTVTLDLILGDASEQLGQWDGQADAWFLDGFSPAKNPDMWSDALMAQVARHSVSGGTAATFTAAGHVRRALSAAGFNVTRVPGYGRKRHMTRAVKT